MTALELVCNVLTDLGFDDEVRKGLYGDLVLKSMGMDSLNVVEIVMQFEERLNTEVTNDELAKLKTVDDLLKLVEKHGHGKLSATNGKTEGSNQPS